MKKLFKLGKKSIAVLLCILMTLPFMLSDALAVTTIDETLLYKDRVLTQFDTYTVTKGVTEADFILNDSTDDNQVKCFILDIDLSNPDLSIVAGYANADASTWEMGTVRGHATAREEKYGDNVVGGVNADYFNTKTGETVGILVMDGKTFKNANKRPFFAILNDGTAVIRNSDGSTADIKEAVGGARILIKDGVITSGGYENSGTHYPRSAVGIKADGSVIFFVADGRQYPYSCGMNKDDDLAATLFALGCVDALSLDGGGSTILVGERECLDSLNVRSTPSYAGIERPVGSSLLVCTSAEPSDEFDHLAFSSSIIKVYPNDSTTFKYASCDENGYAVEMPKGKLVIEDDSYGKLIDLGNYGCVFKATEKLGVTKINYVAEDGTILDSIELHVTEEAPSPGEKIAKVIITILSFIVNLTRTFIEKVGEKTGLY